MEDGKAIRIPTQFESNVSSRYRNRCIHGEGKCPEAYEFHFSDIDVTLSRVKDKF